jgi:hypothetical protein
VITGVAFALIVIAGTSCGDSETEQDRIRAAIERVQGDMAAGRVKAVCSAMTTRPQRQIGSVGHGRKPTTCERDLRELVQSTDTYLGSPTVGLRRARKPNVLAVDIQPGGRKASATVTLGVDRFDIALAKEDGDWKLDDFFGASAPAPQELR